MRSPLTGIVGEFCVPSLLNFAVGSNCFPLVFQREFSTFLKQVANKSTFLLGSLSCQYLFVLYSSCQKQGTRGSYLSARTTYAKRPVLFSVFVSVLDVQSLPVIKTIPISRGPWPAYILTTPFDFFAARENIEALVLSTGSDVKGGESILQSDMQDSFPLKVPFTQPGAAEEVQAVQKKKKKICVFCVFANKVFAGAVVQTSLSTLLFSMEDTRIGLKISNGNTVC